MLTQTRLERLYRLARKRSWLTASARHESKDSRNIEDPHAINLRDSYEDVTREERQFDRYLRSIAPFPIRLIKREKVLNFTLAEVLRYTFLMPAGGVYRKPA